MRLIAGLGNPGARYINTRHNIGFRAIEELAAGFHIKLKRKPFSGVRQARLKEGALLIQPLTFMNRSGACIARYADSYDISLEDILIICDDINLPLGTIKIRPQGTSGGHNGLESIIKGLKTEVFPRLKIGIRPEGPVDDFVKFVLSDFKEDEIPKAKESIRRAAEACLCWLRDGIDKAMNVYNIHNG